MMSVRAVPSRLKKLSLAISQITLMSVAFSAEAQVMACTETVVPGTPTVINAPLVGNVCQGVAAPGIVRVDVNADIDASGEQRAIETLSGSVNLADGVHVLVTDDGSSYKAVKGIDIESEDVISVTLGAGAEVEAHHSGASSNTGQFFQNSFAGAVLLDADAGKAVHATFGQNSRLVASSTESEVAVEALAETLYLNSDSSSVSAMSQEVTLRSDKTSFMASAIHEGGGFARATGVGIDISGEDENLSLTGTLDGGVIDANADSTGTAEAFGILVDMESTAHRAAPDVEIRDLMLDVESKASGRSDASAISFSLEGVTAVDMEVAVSGSEIDAVARGDVVDARGLSVEGEATTGDTDFDVALDDVQINVLGDGDDVDARALIVADESTNKDAELLLNITDSQLQVTSQGVSGSRATAVEVDVEQATIQLQNTKITAVAKGGTAPRAFGVWSKRDDVALSLDASSRIESDIGVLLEGADGSLVNHGTIIGHVGAATVDNHGSITGMVAANALTVRDGAVIVGSSDSVTLNVANGGELQAVLLDSRSPTLPFFKAQDVTLNAGAKLHVNATSEVFNPKFPGIDYTIVAASNSLAADIDDLNLKSSGLVDIDWANCGDLSLCVTVSARDLSAIAAENLASKNGQVGAAAAQSALQELAGSATADEFMDLIERVADSKSWHTLGTSGQGEGRAASRSAEQAVSGLVKGVMRQGRSSGEEFSGARGLWVQALHSDGEGDRQGSVSGFDVDSRGVAIGYDTEVVPGWLWGVALSDVDSELDADDNSNRSDADTVMLTLYSQWQHNAWFANGLVSLGRSENDSHRVVAGNVARGNYDSDVFSFRTQLGKSFVTDGNWVWRPRAEANYSRVDVDSYRETGTLAALAVDDQRYESFELGLGLELSRAYVFERALIAPYVDVALAHDLMGDDVRNSSRFVIGGNTFVTEGKDAETDTLSATLGVNFARGEHHSLRTAYEYTRSSDYRAGSWMLRYAYKF